MKKTTAFLLVLSMLFIFATMSFSASGYSRQAETLSRLGLFLGTDNGFELDRVATRAETAVMTVRLLGKEAEAVRSNFAHPFSDVPEWAGAHVGYLYRKNIAKGVADDLFGSDQTATPEQFATFVLRALGYDDASGDFAWDRSLEKMVSLEIITELQSAEFASSPGVLRGDAAAVSYYSLFANLKGSNLILLEKLFISDGAISKEQLKGASDADERVASFACLLGIGGSLPEGGALTSEEIYAKAANAVFTVHLEIFSDPDAGSGSGFFITPDGIAVTNMHVIQHLDSATVTTADGKTYPVEGVLAMHTKADIAVIKVKGSNFEHLEIGDESALRIAQRIYCIGSPGGLGITITDGLISSLSKKIGGHDYIQISAPIAPGSSGGAMLNEYGQAVGVTTAASVFGQITLATPITKLSSAYRFSDMRSFLYLQAHSHFNCLPIGDAYTEAGDNDTSPAQTMKNDTIMIGTISSVDDADCYYLDVKGKSDMLVSLSSNKAHSAGLKFEICDPKGNVIFKSRDYKGDDFSLAAGHAAAKGKYIVRVYVDDSREDVDDSRGDVDWSGINYELFWIYHSDYEITRDSMLFIEFEPNDDTGYANYMPNYATYFATVQTKNDVDWYSFTLSETRNYVSFINTSNDKLDIKAEIFNDAGKREGEFEYVALLGMTVFKGDLPAGNYYIKVSAKDANAKIANNLYSISGAKQKPEG